jgi:hypothetical protein
MEDAMIPRPHASKYAVSAEPIRLASRPSTLLRGVLYCVVLAGAAPGQASFSFTPTSYATSSAQPLAIAAATIDTDAFLDLVVVNETGTLDLLTSIGPGVFAAPVSVVSGLTAPQWVAAGDFDTDGDQDFVVVGGPQAPNSAVGSGQVFIALDVGPTLSLAQTIGCGVALTGAAVADLNGDQNPDVAVVSQWTDEVFILIGDGIGGFASPVAFATPGVQPRRIAAGDLNGDLVADLVIACIGSDVIGLMFGNGSGGFTTLATITASAGSRPFDVTLRDLDADGDLDVAATAVTRVLPNDHVLLAWNAGGVFPAVAAAIPVGNVDPYTIVVTDLDRDCVADLATANGAAGVGSVHAHRGTGAGLPMPFQSVPVGLGAFGLVAADLDDDGDVDLATADFDADSVTVLINTTPQRAGGCGGVVVTVPGTQGGYVSTSVMAGVGDAVAIHATGYIGINIGAPQIVGPEGTGNVHCVPSAPAMGRSEHALVARIAGIPVDDGLAWSGSGLYDDGSQPTQSCTVGGGPYGPGYVGPRCSFFAPATGPIELAVNDSSAWNNSGSWTVVIFVRPSNQFPGTIGGDLQLATAVGAGQGTTVGIKAASAFDIVHVNCVSPVGTLDFWPFALVASPFPTGSPPSFPGFPELHLNPATLVVLHGSAIGGFLPILSPAPGSSLSFSVPPGLSGTSVMLQAVVAFPAAPNGLFVASEAHEIVML